jgi:hypothetical protein
VNPEDPVSAQQIVAEYARVLDRDLQTGSFPAPVDSLPFAKPADITDTSQATADELRALWNPMIANAGVYEVEGKLVTIRPIVAKIPVVMKPGAYEVYAFTVEDKTLSLTQQRNVRGPVEGTATTKLVRLE